LRYHFTNKRSTYAMPIDDTEIAGFIKNIDNQ